MIKGIISENLGEFLNLKLIIDVIFSHTLGKMLNWYAFDLYFLREKINEVM